MNHDVSEKLLKCLSVTSDYTDFRRIPEIFQRVTNLCNRYLIFFNQRALYIFRDLIIFGEQEEKKRFDPQFNNSPG
jgi:hypothetical protein